MRNMWVALGIILILVGAIGVGVAVTSSSRPYTIGVALKIAQNYLASLDDPDLAIYEIMEFTQEFYVIYYEKSTGIGAFEMLVNRYTGQIYPGYGPNMDWNTKYSQGGIIGGGTGIYPPDTQMSIDENQAVSIAQQFLNGIYPGTTAQDTLQFYGYYVIQVMKSGKIYGIIAVNGYEDEAWYYSWLGTYIQSQMVS
jgi:hypothetical protein